MELLALTAIGVAVWLWYESQAASPNSPNSPAASGGSSLSNPLVALGNAIFNYEGGGKPGATNSWNNNPGNIGGGQSTYPTFGAGQQALYDYVSSNAQANPQWNFYDFFSNYLGTPGQYGTTAQGNATDYANYVAGQVGADPNSSVWDYLNGGGS